MAEFTIHHRISNSVLFKSEGETLREVVVAAVKSGADLCAADLRAADLRGADLRDADLRDTDLRDTDLGGADLGDAYLRGADLRGADLGGAKINWKSHDLIAEILLRAAECDVEKRKVAGLILISRDWCWKDFSVKCGDDPLFAWAIDELRKWVQDGDEVPAILQKAVREVAA